MDFYDREILTVTKNGKPRSFQQIPSEVGFSYNNLSGDTWANWWMRVSSRNEGGPKEALGGPLFTYGLSEGAEKAVSAFLDPSTRLVVVSFEGLRRFCRREKGGFCKEIRG